MRAINENGARALSQPVARFASKPLAPVPAAAFVYRALGLMSRLKVRHLGVEDENGEICGIITSRDLLRLRAQEAVILERNRIRPTMCRPWPRPGPGFRRRPKDCSRKA